MDTTTQTLETLFAQLGLKDDPVAIKNFVAEHRLPADVELAQAPFWNASQASFIREAWRADSDWCDVIDELNALLH